MKRYKSINHDAVSEIEIKKLWSDFDLPEIVSIESQAEYSSTGFIIITTKNKYYLCLHPAKPSIFSRSQNDLLGEIDILQRLREKRLPVARPIATKDDKLIISVKGRKGFLRGYLECEALKKPSTVNLTQAGVLLAKIHLSLRRWTPPHRRTQFWGPEKIRRYWTKNKKIILASKLPDKKALVDRLEQKQHEFKFSKTLPTGILHEDFGQRHVLWHKNKITGVIDFDRSYRGLLILDVGQAIRGWCFDPAWKKLNLEKLNYFLSGYQSQRQLSVAEKKHLVQAIKFGLVERGLSFLLRGLNYNNREWLDFARRSLFNLVDEVEKMAPEIEKIKNTK